MTSESENYSKQTLADRFRAEARLCERIANSCADETTAAKSRELARNCREWAKQADGGRSKPDNRPLQLAAANFTWRQDSARRDASRRRFGAPQFE
jgi:hypothetical protein